MLFVCYPKCSTCQKAKTWLQERGVAFDERDIKQDNPTEQDNPENRADSDNPDVERSFSDTDPTPES